MKSGMLGVAIATALFCGAPAVAEEARILEIAAGQHFRVDEGVFALRPGQSIDLTNRKILLTFRVNQSPGSLGRGEFVIVINGLRNGVTAGDRINLKQLRATAETVKDTAECFLDIVSFIVPKGAPPTATFRVHCI